MEVEVKVAKKKIGDVEFNEQQLEEFREAFNEFDIDGDGTISSQVRGTV